MLSEPKIELVRVRVRVRVRGIGFRRISGLMVTILGLGLRLGLHMYDFSSGLVGKLFGLVRVRARIRVSVRVRLSFE